MRTSPPQFVRPLNPYNHSLHRCPVSREAASHRILILRLGSYGDILMATPLLVALRAAYPDAHITWIVERGFQDAIIACPYLDEVLLWEGSYWKNMLRFGLYPLWLLRVLKFCGTLRQRHYDIFISLQPEEWPLLTWAVRAPKTIGIFDTFRRFNNNRPTSKWTRIYTDPFTEADLPPHRTDQYLLALRALQLPDKSTSDKRMVLCYTAEDAAAAENLLGGSGHTIVLVPLTTWPSRCWPAERWTELGNALGREHQCSVILIGSEKEKAMLEQIAGRMLIKPAIAGGTLTFRQVAALLARASLVISGDTGPMHVAAALGTPAVALFGPTSIANLAPLAGRVLPLAHSVPCGPCDQKICPNTGNDFMHCLKLLSVSEVRAAAEKCLQEFRKSA